MQSYNSAGMRTQSSSEYAPAPFGFTARTRIRHSWAASAGSANRCAPSRAVFVSSHAALCVRHCVCGPHCDTTCTQPRVKHQVATCSPALQHVLRHVAKRAPLRVRSAFRHALHQPHAHAHSHVCANEY